MQKPRTQDTRDKGQGTKKQETVAEGMTLNLKQNIST